jgi:hypothetical protein
VTGIRTIALPTSTSLLKKWLSLVKSVLTTKETVMPKFRVMAHETVYYMVEVEAESADAVRDSITEGEIEFSSENIVDGDNFNLMSVEPVDS